MIKRKKRKGKEMVGEKGEKAEKEDRRTKKGNCKSKSEIDKQVLKAGEKKQRDSQM